MSQNSPQPPQHRHGPVPSPAAAPAAAASSPAADGRPVAHDDYTDPAAPPQPPYLHDDHAAADALSYPPLDDPSQPLLPPANFSPFFTLIEDAGTGEHHHPAVHYVFSDDDPDLHTAVFMRALGDKTASTAPPSPPSTRHPHHHRHHEAGGDDHGASPPAPAGAAAAASILPPPMQGVRERYVVVDLAPDGQTVAGATSLSRSWQVVGTSIAPAPSFVEDGADNDGDDGGGGGGGVIGIGGGGGALMLRVEGTDMGAGRGGGAASRGHEAVDDETAIAAGLGDARRLAGDDLVGGLDELLRRFEGGVGVLGKIVGPDVDVLVQQQQQQQQRQQPLEQVEEEGEGGVEDGGDGLPPPPPSAAAEGIPDGAPA